LKKQIINSGVLTRTCRVHASNCSSCHAEFNAIQAMMNSTRFGTEKRRKRKKMFDLVVFRTNSSGDFANAKPCLSCAILIRNCGFIRNVIFSNASHGFDKVPSSRIADNAQLLYRQKAQNNLVKSTVHRSSAKFF
jgi:deoxycytidylate deaminase